MTSSRAVTHVSPTSARTEVESVSTADTLVPTRTCAPAASARLASAWSNATRSMTAASGVGVEYGILNPDGDTKCAVVEGVERRVVRQAEGVEAFAGEDAGAVNGIADAGVLFADDRRKSAARQALRRVRGQPVRRRRRGRRSATPTL